MFIFSPRRLKSYVYLSFSVIILIIVLWLFLYLHKDHKTKNVVNFTQKISQTSNAFSQNFTNFQSFLISGYKQPELYTSGNQIFIDTYIDNLEKFNSELNNLKHHSNALKIENELEQIVKAQSHHLTLAKQFKSEVKIRGFRDFGIEGEMRRLAHELEKKNLLDRDLLLQLRRHEKDYLMRGDEDYLAEFDYLIDSINKYYNISNDARSLLNKYSYNFKQLALKNKTIGVSYNEGIFAKINQQKTYIEELYETLNHKSNAELTSFNRALTRSFIIETIILALLLIVISYYFVRIISKDVDHLKLRIEKFVKSNFKHIENNTPTYSSKIKEVNELNDSYSLLKEKLAKTIKDLENSIDEANKNAEYKSRFLANMSHEMRTPLNGLIGMLQMLHFDSLSKSQEEHLEIAQYSANHLLRLINMILDHSKLEAEKLSIEKLPFYLDDEINKLVKIFKFQALEKNLEFKTIIKGEQNVCALGDTLRIQQILINLISNALKFTEKGSVTLSVDSKLINNEYLIAFEVIDTGIGLDENQIHRLFEAFEQGDLSTTRKHGGTGLGLTIANKLIELMGGEMSIKSKANTGTCFCFTLRLPKSEPLDITTSTDKISINSKIEGIKEVLIVEDNKINQKVLSKILMRMGIMSDIASNGIEALHCCEQKTYDIIFMDLNMPIMDGIEAAQRLKEDFSGKNYHTPIIAVTASAFEKDKKRVLEIGMNDFIAKPVDFNNLQDLLTRYVKTVNLD